MARPERYIDSESELHALLDPRRDVAAAVAAGLTAATSQTVTFRCAGRPGREASESTSRRQDASAVEVPCFEAVGVGLLTLAAAWGARTIRFDTSRCAGCPNRAGLETARRAAARAERLLAQTQRKVEFLFESRKGFRTNVPSPSRPPPQPPLDRQMLKLALPILGVPADGHFSQGEIAMWSLKASSACDTCGVCAGACPAGAIELRETGSEATLRFETSRCDGCGLCIQSCPSKALGWGNSVRAGDVAKPPVVIARNDQRPCERTGAASSTPESACAECRFKCPLSAELTEVPDAEPRARGARHQEGAWSAT